MDDCTAMVGSTSVALYVRFAFGALFDLSRSVLGILFTFWVMGFLIYEQKGSFFLPRGTGIKLCAQSAARHLREPWRKGFRDWG